MKGETILIVGGSGFIGSHMHQTLVGCQLINMDLVEPKFEAQSEYRRGDIRKLKDIRAVLDEFSIDVIINLAAEHKDFGVTEEEYFETNEGGMRNLLQAAGEKGINKVVFYSSVAVYGDNLKPSREDMTPNPSNHYGASKLAAEKVIEAWLEEDGSRKVLIMRPTVVYGEGNIANVYRLIKQVESGLYFNIGKADNIKSMAYVKNLVVATIYFMGRLQPGVSIYNYADLPHMTTREIGDVISAKLGKRAPITLPFGLVYLMALPFDLLIKLTGKDLRISTNRIRKLSTSTQHMADKVVTDGFEAEFDNRQGIANMIAWMKSN